MKRLLLLLAITFVSVLSANAQCVPDPAYTEPGIYPDSATGFASACVDELYEQVVTNIVPVDTTVEIIPGFPTTLDFDSIVIVNFTGLPASMTYACSTTLGGCSFAGGEAGCVLISGTPTAAEVGTHNPVITVDVYVGGSTTAASTQDIDWYVIEVLPAGSCTAGIEDQSTASLNLYPNPTENELTLDGLNSTSSISIVSMNGQVMNSYSNINSESFEMNVSNLDSGIYFVKIDNATSSETIRFVKK